MKEQATPGKKEIANGPITEIKIAIGALQYRGVELQEKGPNRVFIGPSNLLP